MVLRGRSAVLLALLLIDAATGAARKKRSTGAGVAREGAATAAGLSAAERFKLATQHQIAGVQLANAGRVGEAVGAPVGEAVGHRAVLFIRAHCRALQRDAGAIRTQRAFDVLIRQRGALGEFIDA